MLRVSSAFISKSPALSVHVSHSQATNYNWGGRKTRLPAVTFDMQLVAVTVLRE